MLHGRYCKVHVATKVSAYSTVEQGYVHGRADHEHVHVRRYRAAVSATDRKEVVPWFHYAGAPGSLAHLDSKTLYGTVQRIL